ncbi:MAG TPA: glycosyltransferase family 1 protein [Candidatus Poseidoniales archaeon]|nr:glycosyltransferase family 1 protein [Candidatus Poseidoniales archaeon]
MSRRTLDVFMMLSPGGVDLMWGGRTRCGMGVRLLVALRDLDPPAGGAEMSLATLLKGVAAPGPYAEDAPDYIPLEPTPEQQEEEGWSVHVFQSSDRGEATDLTQNSPLKRTVAALPVESLWSGLAWRLRNKVTGRLNVGFQRRHLRKRNLAFERWLAPHLAEARASGDNLLGITQLHWSAGAAEAFRKAGIPHMIFVRDELQFDHPVLYRASLEKAVAVCGAGNGLLRQIESVFKLRRAAHVPLPVDYAGRFGTPLPERIFREDVDVPRIAIVGVTPEKGLALYRRLLPHLARVWPEACIDIYGGGAHVEALSQFPNATCHGHTPVEEVFTHCDIHLLTVESTGSWGRVINEAGLFGIPSVSVEIGAQPEAVGRGGVIVSDKGDLIEWTAALRTCYENREALGEAAREHAKVIDHRRSIAMFRSVIRDVLKL